MAIVKIASNAIVAKLINPTSDVKDIVSDLLSYRVEGAEYSQAFGANAWDGCSSFFKYGKGTFPMGFVEGVSRALRKRGHRVQRITGGLPEPLGPVRPNINAFGYTDDYDYQPEAVDLLVERGAMIAQIATGGGKSNICCMAVGRIKRNTLFITTRGSLMYQMKDTLQASIDYRAAHGEPDMAGVKVGVIGDGIWEPKKITVAMVQTLAAKLKDPNPHDSPATRRQQYLFQERVKLLLSKFELVILEEAHEASGDSYYNILNQCKNAHYRLALTATPNMKDSTEDNMRLTAVSGSVAIKVTEKMLIDRGILAKPYFKYIRNPKPAKLYRTSTWRRAYKLGITDCPLRNKLVVDEALKMVSYGLNVLILVTQTAHGDALTKTLSKSARVAFLKGEVDQQKRMKYLSQLGQGKLDILVGTNVLDVGIDVPSIGGIILAGGYKAEVSLRQRIGRGLRKKKTGPNVAFVVDFADEWNEHLKEHAYQRRSVVESTEGFAENILLPGEDFDYSEFTKKAL